MKPPVNLAEALPAEIQHCTKVVEIYKSIGPNGRFAAASIQFDINEAIKACAEGDSVKMLFYYTRLRSVKV